MKMLRKNPESLIRNTNSMTTKIMKADIDGAGKNEEESRFMAPLIQKNTNMNK